MFNPTFRKFSGRWNQICLITHSDRNFQNLCLNGKRRDVVAFRTQPISCTRCSWEEVDQTFGWQTWKIIFENDCVTRLKVHARKKKSAPVCYELTVIC